MAHENATPRRWAHEPFANQIYTCHGAVVVADVEKEADALLIIEAVNAYDTLRAENERLREFVEFVRNAPVSSGVCCCGDSMDRHVDPMSCGHSPVDMWDHTLSGWMKHLDRAALSEAQP